MFVFLLIVLIMIWRAHTRHLVEFEFAPRAISNDGVHVYLSKGHRAKMPAVTEKTDLVLSVRDRGSENWKNIPLPRLDTHTKHYAVEPCPPARAEELRVKCGNGDVRIAREVFAWWREAVTSATAGEIKRVSSANTKLPDDHCGET